MYKVLIVDDEFVIRNGLINFIQWDSLDCEVIGEAINGPDAIEKVQSLNPQIIITDVKMPGLSGIEVAKYVYENNPSIKVIILTGYADFSYAQSALKYGAVAFVLKPTEPDQLIEAVLKAKNMIFQQKQADSEIGGMKNKIDKYVVDLREKLLHEVIDGVISCSAAISDKLAEFDISLKNYYVVVYEIENIHAGNLDIPPDERSRFISSIKNFLSIAFKEYTHYTVAIREYRLCSIVSFDKHNTDEYMQSLLNICREILSTVEGFTNFSISIGISNHHRNPVEISDAYFEAEKALTVNFYNSNNSSLSTYSNQINALSKEERFLTNSYLELIMKQVQEGPQEALKASISELFEKLTLSKQPIDYIKSIGIHLCFSFETLLSNYNLGIADSIQGGNNIYKNIFESNSSVCLSEILVQEATSVLNQLCALAGKSNILIKKVYTYINENYKDNITLQNLADHVHTNSSYLSRLFKNETGSTITDAINKVRLDKAKELLVNSDLKTYEVAAEVGIPDPSYFSVIFKKHFGISPKDYSHKLP